MANLVGTKNDYFVELSDETIWPNPDKAELLGWILRNGSKEKIMEHRLLIASFVDAYKELINKTQKRRNEVCQAIKESV